MTTAELWQFVRAQGLPGREVVALLLGAGLLVLAGIGAVYSWRQPRQELTYAHVVSPLISLGIGAVALFVAWSSLGERYLLRPGAGRYTTATIEQRRRWKGRPRYLGVYYVQGQRYQQESDCGIQGGQELPCPALGSRRYVYFAPTDPATAQFTAVPVPDTLRQVPALGWERLP